MPQENIPTQEDKRMSVNDLYSVRYLQPSNPETPKGSRTWQWTLPDGRQITVYNRLDGEIAGEHFHKGEDPSKNPEFFLLISGEIVFEFIDKKEMYFKETLSAKNGPVELIIHPQVLHRAIPLTDCVFIEDRKTRFNPQNSDTFPPSDFPVKTNWT